MIDAEVVSVVSPLAIDLSKGQMLNVNADTVASKVPSALKTEWLFRLSSILGLLRDVSDLDSTMPKLDINEIPSLLEKEVITGDMRPKVAALHDH